MRSGIAGRVDRDRGQRQRVAQRDQVGGALRRHDAGEPRDREHVALGDVAGADALERLRAASRRGRRRSATRSVSSLSETSTMRGAALGVEMGEAAHAASGRPQRAARGRRGRRRPARISVSPTRKQRAPARGQAVEIRRVGRSRSRRRRCGPGGTSGARALGRCADRPSSVLRLRLLMPISRVVEAQRAVELGAVMHFDQHVEAELARRRPPARAPARRSSAAMISRMQSAPMRAAFDDLIRVEDEILAQHRQPHAPRAPRRDRRRCPGNRARRSAPTGRSRRPPA